MKIFRSIATILVLASLAVCAYSQGTTGGLLYASDFANWSLPQGTTPMQGTVVYPNPDICKVTSNGYTFLAPKVGRPMTVVDGANTETFTPSAVSVTTGACMISGTMLYSHSTYSIRSGTAGAQEAVDYQASRPQGANVILTPAWTAAGGTTAIITNTLTGNTGVSILDQRTAVFTPYAWNGSHFAAQPFPGANISPGQNYQIPCFPATIASALNPCNITADSTGNNLTVPGSLSAASIALSGALGGTAANFTGAMTAATAISSVNRIISVIAPPYNAQCNEVDEGSLTITAGVTSGFTFTSADVGKSISGATVAQPFMSSYSTYAGTITGLSGSNAVVSGSPTITLAKWKYGIDDKNSVTAGTGATLTGYSASGTTLTLTTTSPNHLTAGQVVYFGANGDTLHALNNLPFTVSPTGLSAGGFQVTIPNGLVTGSGSSSAFVGPELGIQHAFDDALPGSSDPLCTATGCAIQFPAGSCLTSTITWKGQPFFGAGILSTYIVGQPGQDIIATLDNNSWQFPINGTLTHDFTLKVDNTVDASGAASGNNTFPNRIAGTLGGTTIGNIITPAISPGPLALGNFTNFNNQVVNVQCAGTITAPNFTVLNLSGIFCLSATSGAGLDQLDSWRVIGAPIVLHGVGSGGSDLVTKISSITVGNGLQINLLAGADPTICASVCSSISGTLLNPITDDPTLATFYLKIGNCGFAFPDSDGNNHISYIEDWKAENINIIAWGGPWQGNHSCGVFMQTAPYADRWLTSNIQGFYGGYIEAFPAANPGGTTWTGDTTAIQDVDYRNNLVPFIIMGGNHRRFTNVHFYGNSQLQTMGPMWLHPGASADIGPLYFECDSLNTGENSRYTSTGNGFKVHGGVLSGCTNSIASAYIVWNAVKSTVDSPLTAMLVEPGANQNIFRHTQAPATAIVDKGLANSIETNGSGNAVTSPRMFYTDRPQLPANSLDGSFLFNSYLAPFANGADLLMTCQSFNFSTISGVNYCVPTTGATGTVIVNNYFQALQSNSNWSGGWTMAPSPQGTGPNGKFLIVGDTLPQQLVNFVVEAQCPVGACTQTYTIKDCGVPPIGACSSPVTIGGPQSLSFGTTWTRNAIPVNLSSITLGHQIVVVAGVPSPWTTGDEEDTTFWAFSPTPMAPTAAPGTNTTQVATTAFVQSAVSGVITGSPVPQWLTYYGNGSDGSLNATSGTTTIQSGEHWYSTCNVSSGAILAVTSATLSAGAPLILRCSTSATIAGTISYSINTGGSNGTTTAALYGGGSGGGGFGAANGVAGNGYIGAVGAGTGGTSGNPGGAGSAAPAYVQKIFLDNGLPYTGTAVGGSIGGQGGSSGGAGGRGGGTIVIVSPTFSFTGTCDVSGQNGVAGGANTGGGGGGSGGICLFRSPAMTNTGTFTLTGGTGGAAGTGTSTAGGNGPSGWSMVFPL